MEKLLKMKSDLINLKNDVKGFLAENKVKEAQDTMEKVRELKAKIKIEEELVDEEDENIKNLVALREQENTVFEEGPKNIKKEANAIRAIVKKITGKRLTSAENALLLPTPTNPSGEHGEGYILPKTVSTKIREKLRQYRSLREVVGYIPSATLTGSFPVEDFETAEGLVDFTDGTDGTTSDEIKFKNISYSLKEKAAFVKLSNTLLKLSDENLIDFVIKVFTRKAIITENKMIIAALKLNKTIKALAAWEDLVTSINTDLDPAMLTGMKIVTNQDGFNYLDTLKDAEGKPLLQPILNDPTRKQFKGFTVEVYSNRMLASTAGKAPIFYGNLSEAVQVVDLEGNIAFATSSEAGFMSNTTIARLIEFIDVVQSESSDECYCYGELTVSKVSK